MTADEKNGLIEFMSSFLLETRKSRLLEILPLRTRHVTVVLENIYQPHNASAILRSCDCFGIQDIHIVENNNQYKINPDIVMGADKWLSLYRYERSRDATLTCLAALREKGYTLVATSPHRESHTPADLPLEKPVALVFGTELEGLSPEAEAMCDTTLRIPMYGFTESLNVSVSASIILYELSRRLRLSDVAWQLKEDERADLLLEWVKASVNRPDILEREYFRLNGNNAFN